MNWKVSHKRPKQMRHIIFFRSRCRLHMIQLFLRLRKERGSSIYVCSYNNYWRAIGPATIFREMGINYSRTPWRGGGLRGRGRSAHALMVREGQSERDLDRDREREKQREGHRQRARGREGEREPLIEVVEQFCTCGTVVGPQQAPTPQCRASTFLQWRPYTGRAVLPIKRPNIIYIRQSSTFHRDINIGYNLNI